MIPKIIHQTWKSKKLSEDFKKWSETWKIKNPSFKYCFYTDKDIKLFMIKNYPKYLELYDFLEGIEKIDLFRYLVLHKYGGVYIDMDCECIKPIDGLIDLFNTSLITGYEYETPVQFLQWFIACPIGCNIMIELVEEIKLRSWFKWFKSWTLSENELIYWTTGPVLYTYVLRKTKEPVAILEKGRLGCYDKNKIDRNTYLIHWFAGSWKTKKCKQPEIDIRVLT